MKIRSSQSYRELCEKVAVGVGVSKCMLTALHHKAPAGKQRRKDAKVILFPQELNYFIEHFSNVGVRQSAEDVEHMSIVFHLYEFVFYAF